MDEGEWRAGGPLAGRVFCRYMSLAEAEAVRRTRLLRGGRAGETFWTDARYEDADEAKSLLSLADRPEVRLTFTIMGEPTLMLDGTVVDPAYGEPGGGTEWMTFDRVRVEVIAVDYLE
jgi:hypothetical protein